MKISTEFIKQIFGLAEIEFRKVGWVKHGAGVFSLDMTEDS